MYFFLIEKVLNGLHSWTPMKLECAHLFNLPLMKSETLADEEKYRDVSLESLVEVCLYAIKMWDHIWSFHSLYSADILLIYMSCS